MIEIELKCDYCGRVLASDDTRLNDKKITIYVKRCPDDKCFKDQLEDSKEESDAI